MGSPESSFCQIEHKWQLFGGNPDISGFGGILRNRRGHWIQGFSSFYGFMSNTNVELLVIHKGLSLVKDNRFQFVVCELDSFLALHLIQMGIPITHPMAPLVKIIVELVSSQWHVMFQHTLREGNKIVDWLTKRELLLLMFSNHGMGVRPNLGTPLQLRSLLSKGQLSFLFFACLVFFQS